MYLKGLPLDREMDRISFIWIPLSELQLFSSPMNSAFSVAQPKQPHSVSQISALRHFPHTLIRTHFRLLSHHHHHQHHHHHPSQPRLLPLLSFRCLFVRDTQAPHTVQSCGTTRGMFSSTNLYQGIGDPSCMSVSGGSMPRSTVCFTHDPDTTRHIT
jgi:hypothetical protein